VDDGGEEARAAFEVICGFAVFDEQLVAFREAHAEVLTLSGGCVKLGGEPAFLCGEAIQVLLVLPPELLEFVLERGLGGVGRAGARAESGDFHAVLGNCCGIYALLHGEAVGERGDGGVAQVLGLRLLLQEALGCGEFRGEGGRAGVQLADPLRL
jgi:hypothetical protein